MEVIGDWHSHPLNGSLMYTQEDSEEAMRKAKKNGGIYHLGIVNGKKRRMKVWKFLTEEYKQKNK